MCSSRKYPCRPQGRLTEIPKGRGVSESQFFERKYDTKMEFLEGWGVQFKKTFHERGMDIFWNSTMYTVHVYVNFLFSQSNIGMDFVSKTMYLEDRTVSLHWSGEPKSS